MQSNVPNAIAQLDDVRWKLAQSLKMMSEALEQVLRIQLDHPFKAPLSDIPLPDQRLQREGCVWCTPTECCPIHKVEALR